MILYDLPITCWFVQQAIVWLVFCCSLYWFPALSQGRPRTGRWMTLPQNPGSSQGWEQWMALVHWERKNKIQLVVVSLTLYFEVRAISSNTNNLNESWCLPASRRSSHMTGGQRTVRRWCPRAYSYRRETVVFSLVLFRFHSRRREWGVSYRANQGGLLLGTTTLVVNVDRGRLQKKGSDTDCRPLTLISQNRAW